MKSIGESRSKQEEDKIIVGEIAILKQHLSAPNISAKKMKDLPSELTFIEESRAINLKVFLTACKLDLCGLQ